jgi:cobalt-zinc-cadmium efflux system protein
MTAFISAVALVVIAVYILWEAYQRLIQPHAITHPWLFLTVAVIGLLGNLVSVWLLHTEKGKSLNLKTAFLHMAFDALSSVAVIAGGVVILLTGWVIIDVILSVAIALAIFWSSYLVIKEAVLIFLEAVPSGIEFDKVHRAIESIPRVAHVHDLHIWSLSSQETALSCHVCLEDDDLSGGPDVIAHVNRVIREKFGIGHGTVQLEIGECKRSDILCNHDSRRKE